MSYRIRSGDTLSSIAGRYRTSVAALAQANNIQDPNRIITGRDLRIPGRDTPSARNTGRPVSPQVPSPPSRVPVPQPRPFQDDSFSTNPQQTQTPRTEEARTTWADPNQPGKSYESRDGVPRYSQFDSDWASNRLGGEGTVSTESRDSVYKQGCAITASAMAVSALSGQTFTPGQMDAYLDDAGAYSGNSVDFNRVGGAVNTQPPIESKRVFGGLTPDAIDQQLDAGRPVVVGVN
ncbi:MAG: LysM peptidoglycan-binding domain-containing protein, partial [Cystobacter sp.]